MIRTLVVDDEPLARTGLLAFLKEFPDIEIVGEADDAPSAVREVEALSPDLVFLDVQMPGGDGFDVLRALDPCRLPCVVFVTAFDRHALQAFDAHAVDYVLKPVAKERLAAALDRVRLILRGRGTGEAEERIRALLAGPAERPPERLLVRSVGKVTVIPVEEIEWIRADGDYSRVHLFGGEHLLREPLHSLEARLAASEFVRIHRSCLVRLSRVREVRTHDTGDATVVLKDGGELPVSRTYREPLLDKLQGRD